MKWAASRSFSLYVFHYPLLSFLDAVLVVPAPGWLRCIVLGALALLAVAFLARWTEDRRREWQSLVDRAWRLAAWPAAALGLVR